MLRNKFHPLTILEVMVGLSIVLMASGIFGWKVHSLLEKRRFQSDLDRFSMRCLTVQKLAVNTQMDWEANLSRSGHSWILQARCHENGKNRTFSPLSLSPFQLLVNGKEESSFQMEFFSTGTVYPHSQLLFHHSSGEEKSWDFPLCFLPQPTPSLHPGDLHK